MGECERELDFTHLLVSLSGDPGTKAAFKCDFCSPFAWFVLSVYLSSQHVMIGRQVEVLEGADRNSPAVNV